MVRIRITAQEIISHLSATRRASCGWLLPVSNLIELVAIARCGFVWIGGHGEDVSRMSESYDCDILGPNTVVELGPMRNEFRVRIQVPKS